MTPMEAFGGGVILGLLPLTGALLIVGICWAAVYLAIAVNIIFDTASRFVQEDGRK